MMTVEIWEGELILGSWSTASAPLRGDLVTIDGKSYWVENRYWDAPDHVTLVVREVR